MLSTGTFGQWRCDAPTQMDGMPVHLVGRSASLALRVCWRPAWCMCSIPLSRRLARCCIAASQHAKLSAFPFHKVLILFQKRRVSAPGAHTVCPLLWQLLFRLGRCPVQGPVLL
eukprot:109726-Chlamydomonas_euryale.AAC.3